MTGSKWHSLDTVVATRQECRCRRENGAGDLAAFYLHTNSATLLKGTNLLSNILQTRSRSNGTHSIPLPLKATLSDNQHPNVRPMVINRS